MRCTWCSEGKSLCTCVVLCGASACEAKTNRSSTEPTEADLNDPEFHAIWNVIRTWDIWHQADGAIPAGMSSATGTDVMAILNAIRSERLLAATIKDISTFSDLKEATIRDLLEKGWLYRRELGQPDRLEKTN